MNQVVDNNFNDNYGMTAKPDNYRLLTIVGTIIGCCSPLLIGFVTGLVAIYFSTQVDSNYNAGNHAGAASNSKNARILAFVSLGLGVLGMVMAAYQFQTNPEMFQEMQEQWRQAMEEAGSN